MSESSEMMNFIAPKEESSYIKIIGVGGGGTNAVNHMYRQGITGVDFIVCNTDSKSLRSSPVTNKIQLGEGLGAGNIPEVAKRYATDNAEAIKNAISQNTKMLFITAGMGGGTGTGASPVIAQIAKEIDLDDEYVPKILVVAIVTIPFNFEGPAKLELAKEGIEELKKYVDSILIIDNNKILKGEPISFRKAFAKADDVLLTAAKSVAEMITVDEYVTVDFRDVNTVMKNSGTALMGAGVAEGENRTFEAMEQAVTSPLLNDTDISDSQKILLHFTCSEEYEITTEEIEEATQYLLKLCKTKPMLKFGIGFDETLGEKVRVIVVATGFKTSPTEPPEKIYPFDDEIVEEKTLPPANNGITQTFSTPAEPKKDIPTTAKDENGRVVVELYPEKEQPVQEPENHSGNEFDDFFQVEDKDTHTSQPSIFTEPVQNTTNTFEQHEEPVQVATKPEPVVEEPEPVKNRFSSLTETEANLQNTIMGRMREIQKFRQQIASPEGLNSIESVPAYIRRGMPTEQESDPARSEVGRTIIDKDGNVAPNSAIYTPLD